MEGEIELADSKAYKISQQKGAKELFSTRFMDKLYESPWTAWIGSILAFLFGLIDMLKAAMRPGLTAYLVALTSWITFISMDVLQKHGHLLTADQAGAIFDQVTSIVIYVTVICVTWWFGDRRVAKFLMRLKDGNLKTQT